MTVGSQYALMHTQISICYISCHNRQMFANHRLAFAAAEMEVHEAKARLEAQNQLAAAQQQAAQVL